jgi:predicted AlkP superfamily pyrophosphatase or phosphodiesterase
LATQQPGKLTLSQLTTLITPDITMKRLVLLSTLGLLNASCTTVTPGPQPPKLVVAISVDQFSSELFAQYRPTYVAGLKRLSTAIVFPTGYQAHATTETCPGHATLLTGARPARSGIVANEWYDQSVTRGNDDHKVYCAEDEALPGTTSGKYAVSTRHLKVPTLGDRMKRADARSRVVAVAGKDRSAVMMGGHTTDAMWYPGLDNRSYVSLPGQSGATPAIVTEVNQRITQIIATPPAAVVPPRCAALADNLSVRPDSDLAKALKPERPNPLRVYRTSAEFDRATANIAIGLLNDMRLGHGPATDLLAISFAGTDNVGHSFGTNGCQWRTVHGDVDSRSWWIRSTRTPAAARCYRRGARGSGSQRSRHQHHTDQPVSARYRTQKTVDGGQPTGRLVFVQQGDR